MEWNKEFDLGQETLLRLPKRSEIFCHILPKQLSTNIQCMYSKTNQKKYSKILVAFVRMGESDDSVLFFFYILCVVQWKAESVVWWGEITNIRGRNSEAIKMQSIRPTLEEYSSQYTYKNVKQLKDI